MAIVDGLTAEEMRAIEAASVVDGTVVGPNLILKTRGGAEINAGRVQGPGVPAGGAAGQVLAKVDVTDFNTQWVGLVDKVYPVGAIFMSVSATSPATLFGGVWAPWGTGRVPVGIDSSQGEFVSVNQTGGEKYHTLTPNEMPSHAHNGSTSQENQAHSHNANHNHTFDVAHGGTAVGPRAGAYQSGGTGVAIDKRGTDNTDFWTGSENVNHAHWFTTDPAGGNAAANNMPPYMVCYMRQRTG